MPTAAIPSTVKNHRTDGCRHQKGTVGERLDIERLHGHRAKERRVAKGHEADGERAREQQKQITLQRSIFDEGIHPNGQGEDAMEQSFRDIAPADRREDAVVQREDPVAEGVHDDAADQRHQAHHESQVESVPGTQAEFGKAALQHARGDHVEDGSDRVRRRDPHRDD